MLFIKDLAWEKLVRNGKIGQRRGQDHSKGRFWVRFQTLVSGGAPTVNDPSEMIPPSNKGAGLSYSPVIDYW